MRRRSPLLLFVCLVPLLAAGACGAGNPAGPAPTVAEDTPILSPLDAIGFAREHSMTSPNLKEKRAGLYVQRGDTRGWNATYDGGGRWTVELRVPSPQETPEGVLETTTIYRWTVFDRTHDAVFLDTYDGPSTFKPRPPPQPPPQPPSEAVSPLSPPVPLTSGAEAVAISQQPVQSAALQAGNGILDVLVCLADGQPVTKHNIRVLSQKKDVSGNWVSDKLVATQQTNTTGRISVRIPSGNYVLTVDGLPGYNWGNMVNEVGQADIPVKDSHRTSVVVTLGRLTVETAYADSAPMVNYLVRVHTQKKDVSGNWVRDKEISAERTDNSGRASFDVAPGTYAVTIDGLSGYNWGNMIEGDEGEVGLVVRSGTTTVKRVDMGRLVVSLVLPSREPAKRVSAQVYTQRKDAAGNWVQDRPVASAQTDLGGMTSFDLTPGEYAIQVDIQNRRLFGVTVKPGMVTRCDGSTFTVVSPDTMRPQGPDATAQAGAVTVVEVATTPDAKGALIVGVRLADGKPMGNRTVRVYTQRKDVGGNWVRDKDISAGQTDNSGRASFAPPVGNYVVTVDGLPGYGWGNMANEVGQADVPVNAGYRTDVTIALGRLSVGVTTLQGGAASGVTVYVYTQRKDAAGNWMQDGQVTLGQTDNSGTVAFDLTPGQYAVEFRRPGETYNRRLFSIAVGPGKTTTVAE